MRLVLCLCCLAFFSIAKAQAPDYFAFDPRWNVSAYNPTAPPDCLCNENYVYYTDGDTLIDSLVYKKIRAYNVISCTPTVTPAPSGCGNYIINVMARLMRQDGYKIWWYVSGSEYLLFDFDLHTGDYLPVTANNPGSSIQVTAIDTVYFGPHARRRFHLAGPASWSDFLIEGGAHNKGFYENLNPQTWSYTLECFSIDGYSMSFTGNACNFFTATAETGNKKPMVSVYPNPSNGTFYLGVENAPGTLNVEVFNALGEIVTKTEIPAGSNKTTLCITGPGVYFYRVQNGKQVLAADRLVVVQE